MNQPTPTDDELFAAYWKDQERTNFYAHNPAQIAEGLRNVYFLGLAARSSIVEATPILWQVVDKHGNPVKFRPISYIDPVAFANPEGELNICDNANMDGFPHRWEQLYRLPQGVEALAPVSAIERKWIPVTERLPECSLPAVLALHNEGPYPTYWLAFYFSNRGWECALKAYPKKLNVTHWMPLPEYPADVQAALDEHLKVMRRADDTGAKGG